MTVKPPLLQLYGITCTQLEHLGPALMHYNYLAIHIHANTCHTVAEGVGLTIALKKSKKEKLATKLSSQIFVGMEKRQKHCPIIPLKGVGREGCS